MIVRLFVITTLLGLVAGCGSRRRAIEPDAGPPPPVVAAPPPAKRVVVTRVVSPLEEDLVPSRERFAGLPLPQGFDVVTRTGTHVVLEGPRVFAPVGRYLREHMAADPQTSTRESVYYQYALPRGARADAQHIHVLAHSVSGVRSRIDITLVETSSGGTIDERLRKAGWGPHYQIPRSQNQ